MKVNNLHLCLMLHVSNRPGWRPYVLVVLNERTFDVNVQLHVHGCKHTQGFDSFLVSSMNIIHPNRHAAVDEHE